MEIPSSPITQRRPVNFLASVLYRKEEGGTQHPHRLLTGTCFIIWSPSLSHHSTHRHLPHAIVGSCTIFHYLNNPPLLDIYVSPPTSPHLHAIRAGPPRKSLPARLTLQQREASERSRAGQHCWVPGQRSGHGPGSSPWAGEGGSALGGSPCPVTQGGLQPGGLRSFLTPWGPCSSVGMVTTAFNHTRPPGWWGFYLVGIKVWPEDPAGPQDPPKRAGSSKPPSQN